MTLTPDLEQQREWERRSRERAIERARQKARKHSRVMKRRKGTKRAGTPIPKRNRKRQRKRKADGKVYGPLHRAVCELPCFLAGHPLHECLGPVKGHHVKSVGSGGTDEDGEIPACVRAHDELHWSEVKVEQKYGVNLDAIVEQTRRALEQGL